MSSANIGVGESKAKESCSKITATMEEQQQNALSKTSTSPFQSKPIRCIVKLGGAAITCKHELETINEKNLDTVSKQLRQVMLSCPDSGKVLGMDWSKRPGTSETPSTIDGCCDEFKVDFEKFVVVHGAGSFGHFQASKSGVHKGGLCKSLVKAGFVATRISVTSLNHEIVRALAKEGIPSIGMSPFSCGWLTCERNMEAANVSMVVKALDSGFVPVLHGDAVLDTSQDCTILSGDVIIRYLAEELKPEFVVFLTDVLGVHDRPPTEPGAVLLREIAVHEDGSWSVVKPNVQDASKQVVVTVAAHDTTGGMVTKISEAAMIAKLGIDVYIVKAATEHSKIALSGDLKHNVPESWLGTIVRPLRQQQ
ncbi:isopentenyl phosphate kinase-like [Coffea arabica]|uniref:Isopentenyl phosphate kinase n=1 Tax=Coffea arabica TaxID=13443 RepID=A0A6P6VAG0_COFAR|nr:isopentenyl phosphate kinase-like [Coffea arabica]